MLMHHVATAQYLHVRTTGPPLEDPATLIPIKELYDWLKLLDQST